MVDTYDAVVIGGGVVMTCTLFHLARLGCRKAALAGRGELAWGSAACSASIVCRIARYAEGETLVGAHDAGAVS